VPHGASIAAMHDIVNDDQDSILGGSGIIFFTGTSREAAGRTQLPIQ